MDTIATSSLNKHLSFGRKQGVCMMHEELMLYSILLSFFFSLHPSCLGANNWTRFSFCSFRWWCWIASSFIILRPWWGQGKHPHLFELGPHQHYPRWKTIVWKDTLERWINHNSIRVVFLSDPFYFGNVSVGLAQRGGCLALVPWWDVLLFVLDLANLTMLWKCSELYYTMDFSYCFLSSFTFASHSRIPTLA